MDLVAMQVADNRRNLKATLLYREGGRWDNREVTNLAIGLRTYVSRHPEHPEHLILFEHYTKEETLKVLGGGESYAASQVVGVENLPFDPGFA